jgi:hypothetical protein
LTALHDLVALSGSLVIGLAATEGHAKPEDLWRVSRIDEDWQISQWGADEEAAALGRPRRLSFLEAYRFSSPAVEHAVSPCAALSQRSLDVSFFREQV